MLGGTPIQILAWVMLLGPFKAKKVSVIARVGTCYSAAYTSQTRDQKRFTISDVAVDWHQLTTPQRTMRITGLGPAMQRADIPPPQSVTLQTSCTP